VIDIRGLNAISVTDSYPLPLQENVITKLQECSHITVVDDSGQFHQFLVKQDHRDRFTIILHRGKKRSNVALMGFKDSVFYVQNKINKFLRFYREFCKCYIDNIVVFSRSFEEHLHHLNVVFELFSQVRIFLESKKSYIEYPSITLLRQRVDNLGL